MFIHFFFTSVDYLISELSVLYIFKCSLKETNIELNIYRKVVTPFAL